MSDYISRQAAIDAMCWACGNDCDKSKFVYNAPQDEQVIMCPEHYALFTLPSAHPERKKGKWIDTDNYYQRWKCSSCGYHTREAEPPFCPWCEAEMRGKEE